jgi:hypothetical protein
MTTFSRQLIEDVKLLKFQDELCHVLKNILVVLSPVQKLEVNISNPSMILG